MKFYENLSVGSKVSIEDIHMDMIPCSCIYLWTMESRL